MPRLCWFCEQPIGETKAEAAAHLMDCEAFCAEGMKTPVLPGPTIRQCIARGWMTPGVNYQVSYDPGGWVNGQYFYPCRTFYRIETQEEHDNNNR